MLTNLELFQWIYRGDDWLLVRRWEYLISIRDQVDIVQVISWNGECQIKIENAASLINKRIRLR